MAKKKIKKTGEKREELEENFGKLGVEEFNTQFLSVSKDGNLDRDEGNHVYDLYKLALKYGTPLQISFPFHYRRQIERFNRLFPGLHKNLCYKGKFFYHYPMKVNQNKEFVLPILSEGGNLEVTSANGTLDCKKIMGRGEIQF